jgi:hypothetical protein
MYICRLCHNLTVGNINEISIYLSIYIPLLDPVHQDSLPDQVIPAPELVIVEGEPEYEVEEVLDSQIFRHQLQYLIKWQGYNILTWEYAIEVNKLKAIDDFHTQHPNKPSPLLEDLN